MSSCHELARRALEMMRLAHASADPSERDAYRLLAWGFLEQAKARAADDWASRDRAVRFDAHD